MNSAERSLPNVVILSGRTLERFIHSPTLLVQEAIHCLQRHAAGQETIAGVSRT